MNNNGKLTNSNGMVGAQGSQQDQASEHSEKQPFLSENERLQWQKKADHAQQALALYWNDGLNMFDIQYPCQDCNDIFHYWWQAHAIDVLVDAYERTEDTVYLDRADNLYAGIVRRNGGITNDYYDDMLWLALALLRLYEHTENDTHREAVYHLWEDIREGWNDHVGGGIAWRKTQLDYKNTPANGPAVILAARMYHAFGDERDLQWAKTNFEWLEEHLVDPDTGFVWDGANRNGDGEIDKDWKFTYNQGVYIGAAVELYRLTGEDTYLQEAVRTAQATEAEMVDEVTQLLPAEGSDDGGLFKGILVRYVTELIREEPEVGNHWAEILLHNAQTMWKQASGDEEILFAPSWGRKAERPVSLSVQLSGVKLLEHIVKLP